jgi:predicted RND superfamily exporter protein
VAAAVLGLCALSIWGIFHTPFYTSRKAVLPQDTEVSRRLERFLEKFGADADLIVVVENAPRESKEKFADELVRRLQKLPQVQQAFARVDIEFFLQHSYLLVPANRLEQFQSLMNRLIGIPPPEKLTSWSEGIRQLEKWLDQPPPLSGLDVDLKTADGALRLIQFFLEEWLRWLKNGYTPHDIDWQRLVAEYGEGARLAAGKGYFTSRDGRMWFVFVRPRQTSTEFSAVAPFVESVRKEAKLLQEEFRRLNLQPPQVGFTGQPAITYEEFSALQRDITLVITSAGLFILLLVTVMLRSLRWALVVFLPMGLGVLFNSGLTYLTVGHLTMITSAFTAVLFGLGVDYGIFLSSRIQEARRAGLPLEQSITEGMARSARAIFTAGGATILIFGALALVPFKGFASMGLVAATGVAMVLITTWLMQPLLFYYFPPRLAVGQRRAPRAARAKPGRILNATIILAAAAITLCGAVLGSRIPFDYDVLELLPRDSEAAHYQRRMVAESSYQAEVLIFTAPDTGTASRLVSQLSGLEVIGQVQTITDLFPPDAARRVETARSIGKLLGQSAYLKQIRALGDISLELEDLQRIKSSLAKTSELVEQAQEMAFSQGHRKIVSGLEKILALIENIVEEMDKDGGKATERTQALARTLWQGVQHAFDILLAWETAAELSPQTLPPELGNRFFAADGTVAVYAVPARSVYQPEFLAELMRQAEAISPEVTGFPTTHQVFSHLAVDSFRLGTILAGIVCLLWILAALRSLRAFLVAALPLVVGGSAMLGVVKLLDIKFSYANIIALPLVMGLAVDYGIWYAHRWREAPAGQAWSAALAAGQAILLAAVTTLGGLGVMALASYRGVATMGLTLTIGLLCCLATALFVSPAAADLLRAPPSGSAGNMTREGEK